MLALADDAALARLVIAATAIPRRARSRWLHNLARTIRKPRRESDAPAHRGKLAMFDRGQSGKTYARSEP